MGFFISTFVVDISFSSLDCPHEIGQIYQLCRQYPTSIFMGNTKTQHEFLRRNSNPQTLKPEKDTLYNGPPMLFFQIPSAIYTSKILILKLNVCPFVLICVQCVTRLNVTEANKSNITKVQLLKPGTKLAIINKLRDITKLHRQIYNLFRSKC